MSQESLIILIITMIESRFKMILNLFYGNVGPQTWSFFGRADVSASDGTQTLCRLAVRRFRGFHDGGLSSARELR